MALHPDRWSAFHKRENEYRRSLDLRVRADELLEEADSLADQTPSASNELLLSMVLDLDERLKKLEMR